MKKRRAWSTLDEDADEQESAALAASLAAAKDTAAQSDALLSSAKEDLNDHQRWLQAQSAAVERDRDRHERWLQRQQDLRAETAKKDRLRRHRRLVRQRALQAVRQAFVDLFVFIRSWIAFGVGKVAAALRLIARTIAGAAHSLWQAIVRSVSWVARGIGRGLSVLGRTLTQALTATGRTVKEGALWTGRKLGLAARGAGAGVAAGAAWSGSKAAASVRAGSHALAIGSQATAEGAGKLSRKTGDAVGKAGHAIGSGGRVLGSRLASTGGSAAALAAATGGKVATSASVAASKAVRLGAAGGRELSRTSAWAVSRLAAIPSKLFIHIARLGHEVQHFARVRAATPGRSASANDQTAPPIEVYDAETSAESASVYVFERYGPHPDGTRLFGQPANTPSNASQTASDADPMAETGTADRERVEGRRAADAFAVPSALKIPNTISIPSGLGAGVGAKTAAIVSTLGSRARAGSSGAVQFVRTNAAASSAWLGKQAARAKASARSGLASVDDAREAALAQSTDWVQKRGLDLSQMMIIAGAVLLVLGGLLIGGGFLMRSTSDPVIAAESSEETFSKITWAFDQPGLALPDRAVFTLSGTPEAFLINGVSIAGVNNSDAPLTDLEAALSPDVQRPDLLLDVTVEETGSETGASRSEPGPVATVPAGASFRLRFLFPPEATGSADGITVDDFFESYGGLLLKLRYDADGAERSVLQYLEPEMLKAQLDEVAAQAGGS